MGVFESGCSRSLNSVDAQRFAWHISRWNSFGSWDGDVGGTAEDNVINNTLLAGGTSR